MKEKYTSTILLRGITAILLISVSFCVAAQDQDMIYLVDETPVKGEIVEVSGKKVRYKRDSGQVRSFDAKQVTMLFNESGSFLIFPAQQLTDEAAGNFITSAAKPSVDLLITLDKQVIAGTIISASEHEVMYQDARQQTGERSIGKDVLAIIIFKNGQHELLVSPSQASEILYATKEAIEKLKVSSTISSAEENKPLAETQQTVTEERGSATPADIPAGAATQQKEKDLPKASSSPDNSPELMITEEELTKLQAAALEKIQALSGYMKILSTAHTDREKVKKTIDLACALFVDEEARVEVSNVQTGVKNKYKIRDYLNRLSMQTGQQGKNEIEYTNINYASAVKKSPDGSYYRQIEYMQTFKGLSDDKLVYGDVAKRKAAVNQKVLSKEAATREQVWDVFLSDIGVVDSQKF